MESSFFRGLTSEDYARIASRTTEVHLGTGDELDYERGIYLLIEGVVEVLFDGKVVRRLKPGEGIGLASALGLEERRGFSARAAEHSHLMAMTSEDFNDVLTEYPEVAIALLRDTMRTVLQLMRRLEESGISLEPMAR